MSDRPVQSLVTVLPVLSAGLYLLGLSYHQGYLAAFGIDDSLYPLATDRALFSGLLAFIGVSFPAVVYGLLALGGFVVAVLVAAVLSSSARVRAAAKSISNHFPRLRARHQPSAATTALLDKSFVVYGYSVGVVLVLLALLLAAVFSSKLGRKQAEREQQDFLAGRGWFTTAIGEQQGLPAVSKLVMCGEHWCSFWSARGAVTVRRDSFGRLLSVQQPASASSPSSGAAR